MTDPRPQRYWPAITPRQQRLLFNIVDWARAEPDGDELIYFEFAQASFLTGTRTSQPSAPTSSSWLPKATCTSASQHPAAQHSSLTAEGYGYYEDHQRDRHPAEILAARVREYVDTVAIADYPEAADRLKEAAEALWSTRRDADVTAVGFKCREALQSFAQSYYMRFFYPRAAAEPLPKENTRDLVSKVVRHLQQVRGERDTALDDALYWFWRRLIDLNQKVVHDTTTPERPLTWEDGRRVLLYSYLLIGELHLLATGGHT